MSMKVLDLNNDGKSELYFTYSWGSGVHRSHAAYFDPIIEKIVPLEYTHMNKDMMLLINGDGGLSLYDANIEMTDFVNYDMEATDFISNIIYSDGKIILDSISVE